MDESAWGTPQRTLIGLLLTAGVVVIMMTTEQCFDQADVKNAIRLAQQTRAAPQAPTLPDALSMLHGSVEPKDIAWSGRVVNSCYGFVRVRAAVPAPQEVVEYLFDVDVGRQRLHPANTRAAKLMEGLRDGALPSVNNNTMTPPAGAVE